MQAAACHQGLPIPHPFSLSSAAYPAFMFTVSCLKYLLEKMLDPLSSASSPSTIHSLVQVYNLSTYGNFVGFLEQLGVDSEPSDMSFACSVDAGRMEWGSDGLAGIFAQRKNLLSLSHWRMVWDVIRFGRQAPKAHPPTVASQPADVIHLRTVQEPPCLDLACTGGQMPCCRVIVSRC